MNITEIAGVAFLVFSFVIVAIMGAKILREWETAKKQPRPPYHPQCNCVYTECGPEIVGVSTITNATSGEFSVVFYFYSRPLTEAEIGHIQKNILNGCTCALCEEGRNGGKSW